MVEEFRVIISHRSLLMALHQMDEHQIKSLLVYGNDNDFIGLLSIGDIQRAILADKSLDTQVGKVLRKNITLARDTDEFASIKQKMLDYRTELMPVVNGQGELVKIYLWEEVFGEKESIKKQFNCPIVIMAGGKGTRLKPLTNVLPKPLIPIGAKSTIEHIMDRFVAFGSCDFHLSVNYKADMIKYYFDQLSNDTYNVSYFQETKPLGTAGSLSLLKDRINQTFFISNCDIIIDADYSEILDYHRNGNHELTMVAALKHYNIPYGTLETSENGKLMGLKEKPEMTFKINSGMYILEPSLLNQIPNDSFFHITELIQNILDRNGRVGVFPISEGSWIDIGQWDEYLAIKDAKL